MVISQRKRDFLKSLFDMGYKIEFSKYSRNSQFIFDIWSPEFNAGVLKYREWLFRIYEVRDSELPE